MPRFSLLDSERRTNAKPHLPAAFGAVSPAAADRVSTVSGGPNIPQNLQKVRIYI